MIRIKSLSIFLCVVFSLAVFAPISAADPITARVLMPAVTDLDPVALQPGDLAGRDVAENLFVGLTRHDPISNTIAPMLAREWTVSPDGLTWTFTLRNDIQWVRLNAQTAQPEIVRPVVAGDFTYAIRRACDSNLPNPVARTVFIISGCRTVATANPLLVNDIFIAQNLGVKVLNPTKLEVKLLFPAPHFPALLTQPEFRPVPREAIAQNAAWAQGTSIVSNGPWLITSRDTTGLTLARNPFWPDPFAGNVERIAVELNAPGNGDPTFAANRLRSDVDFARLDATNARALGQSNPTQIETTVSPAVAVLGFSAERGPLSDAGVRRALALSIDRSALVSGPLQGSGFATWRITPPIALGGNTEAPDNRGFKRDLAVKSLSASKAPRCRFGEKLDFFVVDTPESLAIANSLVSGWVTTLGCRPDQFVIQKTNRVTIERIAQGTFSTIRSTDPLRPHLWLATWTPDHLDQSAWTTDGVHCQYGFFRANVACGDADKLIEAASLNPDPEARRQGIDQAEQLLFGDAGTFPVAPLYFGARYAGHSERLTVTSADLPVRFDLWQMK